MYTYKILDPEKKNGEFVRALRKDSFSGVLFPAMIFTKEIVSREYAKRLFWKAYKIDIDKPYREILPFESTY